MTRKIKTFGLLLFLMVEQIAFGQTNKEKALEKDTEVHNEQFDRTRGQTGYFHLDIIKWIRIDTVENSSGRTFLVFYQDSTSGKIIIELIGNIISYTTVFYFEKNKLTYAVYAAYTGANNQEEHYYFSGDEMTKWVNTSGEIANSKTKDFVDKQTRIQKYFNEILIKAKNKKH